MGKADFLKNSLIAITLLSVSFNGHGSATGQMVDSFLAKDSSGTPYNTYRTFDELVSAKDAYYLTATRVTPGSTETNPTYYSFWFYNCAPRDLLHFDPTGRYIVVMRVHIEGRTVLPTDEGEIGIIDLQDNNKWAEIGKTTAWNWQQGNRLQWVPGSDHEIIWNDRADDGKSFVSRVYDVKTKKTRVLPRPIYVISPDGKTALTHDFERMKHAGTNYVGIEDNHDSQWAPRGTGVWKMDMKTGKQTMLVSLRDMAKRLYPDGLPADTLGGHLYVFREGWNPAGKRFIVFFKRSIPDERAITWGYSMNPAGTDIRYLYFDPSHHYWVDNETVVDWGNHRPPGESDEVRGYHVFKDDGSGESREMFWAATNGHDSYHPNGEWILTDTYNLDGYQYLYLFHLPTKLIVPLGKFKFMLKREQYFNNAGIFRVDLHPRFSPDGRRVSFDSTHEGLGRQVYIMDVGDIIDNPPLKSSNTE